MIGSSKKLLQAAAGAAGGGPLAIEDVFSTYLYTGNDSTQTITNGIDLAGEGGLIWTKARTSSSRSHYLVDTERPINRTLTTNTTDPQQASSGVTSITSTGYTLDSNAYFNTGTFPYVSWTFRKAPRFFDVVTYTGTGSARTVSHNLGTTVGCLIVKRTDTTQNWYVYHRGVNFGATQYPLLLLNTTGAASNNKELINSTEPTDTQFSVASDLNTSGGTYVAYLFAHDPLGPSGDGSDGLIACGSTTGGVTSLGFEPQWVLVKNSTSTGYWRICDNMRGMPFANSVGTNTIDGASLFPNVSFAEDNSTAGLKISGNSFFLDTSKLGIGTYIYIAIRRGPMREPTSGTEVFVPAVTGLNTSGTAFPASFPPDFLLAKTTGSADNWFAIDRLRGGTSLYTNLTDAESSPISSSFALRFDGGGSGNWTGYVGWMFRRAPGFFDVVCWTGDGTDKNITHQLGVVPEIVITKTRSTTGEWYTYVDLLWSSGDHKGLNVRSNAGASTTTVDGSGTFPYASTTTTFGVGGNSNLSGETKVAYLFATLPGVSKVGSYTGNGSSQTINCGFTGGARFVLIKRTNSIGDWYVWDTARGIVSGNDPHLSLNTTAAEVTSDDTIDPDSSGFIVNQVSATNVNVSSASYIYLAIA